MVGASDSHRGCRDRETESVHSAPLSLVTGSLQGCKLSRRAPCTLFHPLTLSVMVQSLGIRLRGPG